MTSEMLLDVASGKQLKLGWAALAGFEEKVHPETQDRYLVLLFDDGTQLALVDPGGVAFAPSTVHSGPVENLPAVVCLRDFLMLKQRVDHFLYDHPDEPSPRECLNLDHDLHRDSGRRTSRGIRRWRSRGGVGEIAR